MNAETKLCPSCGYDLVADEPIWRPEVFCDPRGVVLFRGKALELAPNERIILHSLLKADGRFVGSEALRERIDGPDQSNVVQVYVCKLRMKLAAIDASRHWIVTVRGAGYRWAGGDGSIG